jgi:hypothetical protein
MEKYALATPQTSLPRYANPVRVVASPCRTMLTLKSLQFANAVWLRIPYDSHNKQRLFTIQRSPTALSNVNIQCSLWRKNWICIWCGLISVFERLNLVQFYHLDHTTCSRNLPHRINPKNLLQCSKMPYRQTNPINILTPCQLNIHFNPLKTKRICFI